jgi:dihydroorotase
MKLHMRDLKSLTEELERLAKAFSRRSVPRDVRNRINRLEKVIAYKTTLIQEALNESGRTGEES